MYISYLEPYQDPLQQSNKGCECIKKEEKNSLAKKQKKKTQNKELTRKKHQQTSEAKNKNRWKKNYRYEIPEKVFNLKIKCVQRRHKNMSMGIKYKYFLG